MSETTEVEFAGITLKEGDAVSVTYDDGISELTKDGEIDGFTYVDSRFMPTHVVFGAHDSVCEEDVIEIEKVA